MKIFVSGATGYIGAHLVARLVKDGHTVHALVRSAEKAKQIQQAGVVLFPGDLLDPVSVDTAMKGCDQAYHLAAFAKVWAKDPRTFFELNVTATINVLRAAENNRVKRTVVTSTAGIYGPSVSATITEETVRALDFFNEYESSKALAESRIKDFVIDGLEVVIVSPTRVYGPCLFGEPESVTLLMKKYVQGRWRFIPGDGTKTGNYIFIDDVVNGHLLAMQHGKAGSTYLLGGENHDYNTFFELLSACAGIKRKMIHMPDFMQLLFARFQLVKTWFGKEPLLTPKWVAKGKYNWTVSAEKAKSELGLKPLSLKEGIQKTVDWLLTQRE